MGNRLARLFHTVRHLKLRQVAYQIFYRSNSRLGRPGKDLGNIKVAKITFETSSTHVKTLQNAELQSESFRLPANFCFLNLDVKWDEINEIDWNYSTNGKLWVYNLNYFEFLRQKSILTETGEALINSWIKSSSNHKDAWEPYPTSLRIVNWIQFFRTREIQPSEYILKSLLQQYQSLWGKLEYHLDGNHLLENAIALCLSGSYFGTASQQEKSAQLLLSQLDAQYLESGEHFERSIMYQLVLLYRQLDLFSVLTKSATLHTVLAKAIAKQIGYTESMVSPSGAWPHFNDSTFGIAPNWSMIKEYASAQGINNQGEVAILGTPRYVHWQGQGFDFWFDAAPIGPDYIPGHAHADSLCFALHVKGRPVLVDTGISTYEKNARRTIERATSSHNTVEVGLVNSSDVWGGFRVGNRAQTFVKTETACSISAHHSGYKHLGIVHHRTVYSDGAILTIIDQLDCKRANISAKAYLHFDHSIRIELSNNRIVSKDIIVNFKNADSIQLDKYNQALGFNKIVKSHRAIIDFTDSFETIIEVVQQ